MSIRVEEIRSAAAALAVIVLLHGTASAQNRIVAAPRSDVVETDSATLPASLIRTPKAVPAPPSRRFFGAHVEAAQTIVVEPPDTTALESEDSTSTEKCRRVGVTLAVDHDPARVRGWRSDGAEGRFWTGEIDAPNARSMRVHFTQFALPPGAQVFVHAADDLENVFGPFEGTGIYPNGEFWSQTIGGERVVVEYWEPKVLQTNKLPFRIADIVYDYADPDAPTSQLGGSCEQDATCFPGFAFEGDAVGRMRFVDGTNAFVCTGTLLTTIAGDWTPYFLTANHCIASNTVANTLDVTWFYETPTCNGIAPDPSTLPHSLGATYLDGRSASALNDFTLLLIDGALPSGVVWAGWTTATPAEGEYVAGIHHPNGNYRRFSFGLVQGTCWSSHFDCVQWIYGVTEGGSSGSGLFDLNHRLVGQLRGGASSCSNPTGIDDYGKFVDSYGLISGWLQAGADDGLENDDSCAGARFLNPGYYGGLVVKSVDADWYRVDVPPLSRIAATIGFTHANGDIDFAMYDGCGGPLVSISSGVGNSETVTWDNRTSVTHSIYLNPYLYSDTRNDYAMNIVVAPCATEDSFEDNDTCATATPAGDSYYDSLFVSKTDPDWFRVTVYPYSTRYVAIYFTHAVADVDMIAYDDCGGSLVASSTGVGNSEVFPLTNSTDTTHDYFVNVYVYGFSAGNCNTYRFDASLPICVFDDGFENNDSCDVATAVASGTYGDLYSETGDPDWFHVSVPSGATLRCDVTGGGISVGDVDEFLFDDCGGNLVAYSNGRTNSESLTFVNAGDDRDFLLNISLDSGTCVSYTLTIDVTPGETLVGNVGVDAGAGPIDVLFVNGSSGAGPRRSLGISETEAIDVSLIAAPYGPLNARYAIFAWAAPPTAATASIIPYGIGRIAMNPLIPQCGSVCPIAGSVTIRTNCNRVRCSTAEATGALPPGVVMTFGAGRFAAGQTLFIQGVMRDNSDTSPKRVSVTNGVEVSIVP